MMNRNADLLFDALSIRVKFAAPIAPMCLSSLMTASHYDGIKFLTSPDGRRLGYYVLARVNSETLKIVKKGGAFLSHPYEANEGKIVVIHDVVFDQQFKRDAKKALKLELSQLRFFCVYRRGALRFYKNKRRIQVI